MADEQKQITTTLGDLVAAEPYLRRVCGLPLRSKAVPEGITPKVKHHLVRLWQLVATETEHFQKEQAAVFADLGIVTGQKIEDLPPGVWAEYLQRIKPHGEIEVVIERGPVSSADIPLALASDLIGLGPLVELVEPSE